MTNQEIENRLVSLAKSERKITLEILKLISEAEERRIPEERGSRDTVRWLVRTCKYSESAARRRACAARLLKEVPEIAEKLIDAEVNLSTLTQTQCAIAREERQSGKKLNEAKKRELIQKIEGKTMDQVERVLATEYPDSKPVKETLRAVGEDISKLTTYIDDETRELLERMRALMSHSNPNASTADVIKAAAQFYVEKKDPVIVPVKQSSKVGWAKARKIVIKRAQGKCEYQDPQTKQICGSEYQLEVDHIVPKVKGGADDLTNLRCVCKRHNLFAAERELGTRTMAQYRRQTHGHN